MQKIRCVLALMAFFLAATSSYSVERAWSGGGDKTNWFDAANWSPSTAWPQDGDTVIISNSATLLLTNSTAQLGRLTLTNAMLTCSNWDTRISATNLTLLNNGRISLPAPFTNGVGVMSNRIYMIATNLFIEKGGQIVADGKGYACGRGPGSPGLVGGSLYGSGGGYGGRGGDEGGYLGGPEYGSTNAPLAPGSGGRFDYAHDAFPTTNGAGGGAVRIEAGTVIVNGMITANGSTGPTYSGGGSGGSIYISCSTFGGTNGLIRVNGGGGGGGYIGGGGGGGRIAVDYTSVAGTATVLFSAAAGADFVESPGGMGTLYLPDTALITSNTLSRQFDGVRLIVPGWNAWAVDSLTVSSNSVCFGEGGFAFTVANALVVQSNGWLAVGAKALSSRQAEGFTDPATNALVSVGGDLLIRGGTFTLGGLLQGGPARLLVGGQAVLTNAGPLAGRLYAGAGPTNAVTTTNGGFISIAGAFSIASNAWYYPLANPTNGGTVRLQCQSLAIQPFGGINTDEGGYRSYSAAAYGPGAGVSSGSRGGGGGYGGKGGNGGESRTVAGGLANGDVNRPLFAGSAGGFGHTPQPGYGHGGGYVRIETGALTLNGTITANGKTAIGLQYGGGGAGGGIFLLCDSFAGATTGVMRANGGSGSATLSGGGGGGRIAVAIALSPANREKLIAGADVEGLLSYVNHGPYTGAISVSPGTGVSNGSPGSAVFLTAGAGTYALDVRGDPGNFGQPFPQYYGMTIGIPADSVFTNAVVTPADTLNGVRRACLGWTLKTADGAPVATGAGPSAVVPLSTNMVLTWRWTNEYALTVAATPGGTVNSNTVNGWYTNGFPVSSITASPADGCRFYSWIGDVPLANEADNPLTVTLDQPRVIRAGFGSATGETKVWRGSGLWEDDARWTPAGMPGQLDEAIVASGNLLLWRPRNVRSLIISNNATMTFTNWTAAFTASNDFIIRSGGTITLPPRFSPGENSNRVWIVSRNVTLETNALINADACGYLTHTGPGKGAGTGSNGGSGGGHGGKGGASSTAAGGAMYGLTNAPQAPGSGAGGNYDSAAGHGGGVVWIDASGLVTVDGTISANGQFGGLYNGGGAGGSVFIISRALAGASTGLLRAEGGNRGSTYAILGGGGGGRIAVWHGKRTAADREKLLLGQSVPGMTVTATNDSFLGTLSVTGGTSYAAAESGTVVFIKTPPLPGTLIVIR